MATTFTRKAQTYNAETGVMTTVESTVAGAAFQRPNKPHRFDALGLSLTENLTLFFTPTIYGQVPVPGDEVTWPASGTVYRVNDVEEIAPDGVVIAAYVVIGR